MTDEQTLRARHATVTSGRTDPGARPSMTWKWCACGRRSDDCEVAQALAIADEARAERDAAWEVADRLASILRDVSVGFHRTDSIRDHADPDDKTGWHVHGIETCADIMCVDSLQALAAYDAARGERGS